MEPLPPPPSLISLLSQHSTASLMPHPHRVTLSSLPSPRQSSLSVSNGLTSSLSRSRTHTCAPAFASSAAEADGTSQEASTPLGGGGGHCVLVSSRSRNQSTGILKRVPNSALWLLRFPAAGERRLRAYAAAQGLQPDQIIFTDVAMKNEHIRRSALADLFLDTPLCNAHTTGTDILWAGLPMITLPLEKMATRVAGSLCLATGLGEEMIVPSMKEYEERAVSLALSRPKLQALTNKLKSVRMTCPLFDTARWVRNLERGYFKMWNLHCSGQRPQHFKVTENDLEYPYDR